MRTLLAAAAGTALALTAAPLAADDHAAETAALQPHELGDREIDMEAWGELTEGRVAGEPKSCVNTFRSQDIRIVENVGMVYEQGDTVWIALARHPQRLDDWDVPVIQRMGSQLCKFDQITLLDRSTRMFSGVLFLDDFVPYTKVKDAEA